MRNFQMKGRRCAPACLPSLRVTRGLQPVCRPFYLSLGYSDVALAIAGFHVDRRGRDRAQGQQNMVMAQGEPTPGLELRWNLLSHSAAGRGDYLGSSARTETRSRPSGDGDSVGFCQGNSRVFRPGAALAMSSVKADFQSHKSSGPFEWLEQVR